MSQDLKLILDEVEATIELFSTPGDYHGSEKNSKQWHEGWEAAAHEANLTLRMVRNLLLNKLKEI